MPDQPQASSSPHIPIWIAAIGAVGLVLSATIPVLINRNSKIDEGQTKNNQLEATLKRANERVAALEEQNNDLQQDLARQTALLAKQAPNKQNQLDVHFTSPQNGSRVEHSTTVEYEITGPIPNGFMAYLLVKDPQAKYWSWGRAMSGRMPNVTFGEEKDVGHKFEIGILIADHEPSGNSPIDTLPPHILYKYITVTRK